MQYGTDLSKLKANVKTAESKKLKTYMKDIEKRAKEA
eukprot:CAMPEP_0116870926 /NCGR_PEP_ID=MMETSP0463-20121206/1053_1 /TAXON_ID=181622 /ORGANISM="Strombidinopsis sp, Strain SopsisLIS2011" /LENGTH=36 /DNA_ID= /DNA_START= /DNA_END= /DNA_ORIENTATION=